MTFETQKSIEVLHNTPSVLEAMLSGLSEAWLKNNEGENTWSPYDIVGHLIHGEKTDWMVRTHIIISDSENKRFEPFDRFAQMQTGQKRTIDDLLKEFRKFREENVMALKALKLQEEDLNKKGIHPELGEVSLRQLLSTWVVHDLGHVAQISRVMAKQYKDEVGPWVAYLGVLT